MSKRIGHEVLGFVVWHHSFCSGGTCEYYLLHKKDCELRHKAVWQSPPQSVVKRIWLFHIENALYKCKIQIHSFKTKNKKGVFLRDRSANKREKLNNALHNTDTYLVSHYFTCTILYFIHTLHIAMQNGAPYTQQVLLVTGKSYWKIWPADYRALSKRLFRKLGILGIYSLYSFHVGSFMYMYHHGMLPYLFKTFF